MKTLVIVESPAKSKTIQGILGNNYKVLSSYGHLTKLPSSGLGIKVDDGSYDTKYIIDKSKRDIVKKLQEEAKKCDEILLASDNDLEGEKIAYDLKTIVLKGVDKPMKRITFTEITSKAIKEAVESPRDIDMNKVAAQQTRRLLDRLIGFGISPFLWRAVGPGTSAGRVQSVALNLIIELENIIKSFNPEKFWDIKGDFKTINSLLELNLNKVNNKRFERIIDHKTVDEVLNLVSKDFNITNTNISRKKINPPLPLKTSTLQQMAASQLGFNASKTMRVAQSLYEGVKVEGVHKGLITYMRTDSLKISDDAKNATKNFIKNNYGEKYIGPDRYFKSSQGAQEAHESIRPTYVDYTPQRVSAYLDKDQLKLYTAIWKRFVACQMPSMEYDQFELLCENNNKEFKGNFNRIIFDGFYKLLPGDIKTEDFPSLNIGDKINFKNAKIKEDFTKPPARMSESGLIKKLETDGIGRPSTYASIIDTIKKRDYVELENKSFKPTILGNDVNNIIIRNFPKTINTKFTANMESKLDKISEGELNWRDVVVEYHKQLKEELDNFNNQLIDLKTKDISTDMECPKCNSVMFLKEGRFGDYLLCSNKECNNKISLKGIHVEKTNKDLTFIKVKELIKEHDEEIKGIKTDICMFGKIVYIKKGKFGLYFETDDYRDSPEDKRWRSSIPKELLVKIKKNELEFKDKTLLIKDAYEELEASNKRLLESLGKCPKCGSDLKICQGKYQAKFIGCTNYPKCKYIQKIK